MKTFLLFFAVITQYSLSAQVFLPQNSGVTSQLNAIGFATPSSGITVGNSGVIRKTANAGLDWTASSSGTTADLMDVVPTGPTSYIAVGKAGTMLKTSNSGTSWSVINSGTSNDLLSIFSNGQYLYVTGANGTVLKSSNYGSAWAPLSTGISLNLNDAYFVSDVVGYVVGDAGTILKTVNGGGAWSFLNSGASGYSLTSVAFPDGMHGVITGGISGSNQSVILHSDDAGNTWDADSYMNTFLNDISFSDYIQGYIAGGSISGNSSTIYSTTNYGASWSPEASASARQLGVCTPSVNIAYTCGLNGTILRFTTNTAGIEALDGVDLELSPNPGTGTFVITTGKSYSIEVFSVDGQFLFELENANLVDLSGFPSGVYLAVIKSDSDAILKRLIKE